MRDEPGPCGPAESGAPSVDVVLPCRDESRALPQLIAAMPVGYRVIVVDNGSRDDTAAVARSLGADVVGESRPGYGSAVHAGLLAARDGLVVVMDGDGSMHPGDLPRLVALAAPEPGRLVVGRRRPVRRGVWPAHARAGSQLVAWRLRRRGIPVHDVAPVRLARRRVLLDLGVLDRRSGYPVEVLLRAARAGLEITEAEIGYLPRAAGTRSKVSGSLSGSVTAARDFARVLRDLPAAGGAA